MNLLLQGTKEQNKSISAWVALGVILFEGKKENILLGSLWLQYSATQWFSAGSNFAPQEIFGNIWRLFWLLLLRAGGVEDPGI